MIGTTPFITESSDLASESCGEKKGAGMAVAAAGDVGKVGFPIDGGCKFETNLWSAGRGGIEDAKEEEEEEADKEAEEEEKEEDENDGDDDEEEEDEESASGKRLLSLLSVGGVIARHTIFIKGYKYTKE
jgi:phosphopantothenoylcysteine synthetase/decarboxylase